MSLRSTLETARGTLIAVQPRVRGPSDGDDGHAVEESTRGITQADDAHVEEAMSQTVGKLAHVIALNVRQTYERAALRVD